MKRLEVQEHCCEICVVGGGLAGCMAAIRAAELNDDVILVDKSNPERSGCAATGLDHIWGYFPEVQEREGVSLEQMVEDHVQNVAQGLVNRRMLHYIAATSYDRILDLERFGARIRFDDSTLPGKLRLQYQMHACRNTLHFEGRDIKRILTRAVRKAGARILDRVMVSEVLTQDGEAAGVAGYGTRDGKIHRIRAKAVIMTTGRVNRLYKPYPGLAFAIRMPPTLTGDGKAAMFRAGVELINMEFLSIPGRWSSRNLIRGGGLPTGSYQPPGIGVNALGEVIRRRNHDVGSKTVYGTAKTFATGKSFQGELEAGRGPIYADMSWGSEEDQRYMLWAVENEGLGPGFLHIMERYGLDFRKHKIELWPIEPEHSAAAAGGPIVDESCQTSLQGLYAAGDEAGGVPGSVAPGAFTMGYLAAESAAKRAAAAGVAADGAGEAELVDFCREILDRSGGDPWEDAQAAIHNHMSDYNVQIRSETMALRGLECLNYLANTMRLTAGNPHELAHCLEMRNLIECGKIIFRSTIERKESRGKTFKRKDYPEQDDANWFCFLGQKLENGRVRFQKHAPPALDEN
jgi:succinate dehydrogenase/fumarate reductase flavoprotein subunit